MALGLLLLVYIYAAMDSLYKILIIGDSGTGKTSMLTRLSGDEFSNSFVSTIGVDFKIKRINDVKLQIWDTAGQERFRTITSSYYRGAHGVVIVFDVSDRNSFADIQHWLNEINNFSKNDNIYKILVGNKTDLSRTVKYSEAKVLADSIGIPYMEISSKESEYADIEKIFVTLSNNIINKKHQFKVRCFRDDCPDITIKNYEKKDKCCF